MQAAPASEQMARKLIVSIDLGDVMTQVKAVGMDLKKTFKGDITADGIKGYIESSFRKIPSDLFGYDQFAALNQKHGAMVAGKVRKHIDSVIAGLDFAIKQARLESLDDVIILGFGFANDRGLIPSQVQPFYRELRGFAEGNRVSVRAFGRYFRAVLNVILEELKALKNTGSLDDVVRRGRQALSQGAIDATMRTLTTINTRIQKGLDNLILPWIKTNRVGVIRIAVELKDANLKPINIDRLRTKARKLLGKAEGYAAGVNW